MRSATGALHRVGSSTTERLARRPLLTHLCQSSLSSLQICLRGQSVFRIFVMEGSPGVQKTQEPQVINLRLLLMGIRDTGRGPRNCLHFSGLSLSCGRRTGSLDASAPGFLFVTEERIVARRAPFCGWSRALRHRGPVRSRPISAEVQRYS